MTFTYLGIDFVLDDKIVKKREERFGDTESDIIEYLTPMMDCWYGKHIDFHVQKKGLKNIENELNECLMTDLDFTDPA